MCRRTLMVLACAGVVLAVASVPIAQSPPRPGQAPYDRACKACHGEEGKGSAAPPLVPFEMDVEELLIRVRDGGGEMPPVPASRVSDDEVRQIASYLKSLTAP